MPKGEWQPPESGELPERGKAILAAAYRSCRDKWADEHPDDIENKDNKESCARQAWSAVHNAGWSRDKDGGWNYSAKADVRVLAGAFLKAIKGGAGSGNWGHAGRPGEIGGSAPGDSVAPLSAEEESFLKNTLEEDDIREARRKLAEGKQTIEVHADSQGNYTPSRSELHEKIVSQVLNPKAATAKGERPRLVLLMGLPGSGKTSVLAGEVQGAEFTKINADDVKEKLPEYRGWNAGLVHEESAHIVEKKVLPKAIKERHNILLDWTGSNSKKTVALAKKANELGYRVEVYYSQVKRLEAAKRVVARYRSSGRFVDPEYVLKKADTKPHRTYKILRKSGVVRRMAAYDNNVPKGEKAKLLERHG